MKAYIIQPPYSRDVSFSDECFSYKLNELERCDDTADIIILPEYSDVPCATSTLEETLFYHRKYIDTLLEKCAHTAKRCDSLVFVNALCEENGAFRNTTYVYDRQGKLAGKYFKRHIPPFENQVLQLDEEYANEFSEPYVIELDGLRYGFLTCYDFYFYEAFANIARQNVDIIIGCSLQRSDSHDAIEIMCRFLAYNTNAYVLRSSVSFGEDSKICGASIAVSPYGKVLGNMQGRFGTLTVEFDPNDKHLKPAGFGNPDAAHHEYIEYGRKPWQYRVGGPSVALFDSIMKYPRICAKNGFQNILPHSIMAALGAAVGIGANEIAFDLRLTDDGRFALADITLPEDVYFEDILKKFAGQVIMNVNIKPLGRPCDAPLISKIVSLLRKYDCERHVYFTIESDEDIAQFKKCAPHIPVCVGHDSNRPFDTVERAISLGAEKVQLCKSYVSREMVERAHANSIICNIYFADDVTEAREYLEMGIDTVLINDCNIISQIKTELT